MIDKFLNELQMQRINSKTLHDYKTVLNEANDWKSLDTWTRDDLNTYLNILQPKLKPSTFELRKSKFKKYFIWIGKKEIVENISIKMPKNGLNRDDILTPDDVTKLIDSTSSKLYKALIAFLWESGARINEATNIKVKDVSDTDKGVIVSIPATKTGKDYRRVLCPLAGQYIHNHISYSNLESDDILFDIDQSTAWINFEDIRKKAGISKKCNPHAFRHGQATNMVLMEYNESIIRKKLGWTDDSKMIARYTHICDDDVLDATAAKNGSSVIPQKPIANIKGAEPLKLTDAAGMFSKMNAELEETKQENAELKAKQSAMEELINTIAKKLDIGDMPRDIGMVKKWQKV